MSGALDGKAVMITGAAGGIGSALTEAFLRADARVDKILDARAERTLLFTEDLLPFFTFNELVKAWRFQVEKNVIF